MKKTVSLLLCLILICSSVIPAVTVAAETEDREYLEDGSYFDIVINDGINEEAEGGIFAKIIAFFRQLIDFIKGQKTVSKTKQLSYYSADGRLLWTAMLTGEFVYTKYSAVCNRVAFNMDIYDSDWKLKSSEYKNEGNKAFAEFTVRQYKLSVPLKVIEKTMTLVCDTNGNVQ